ncbi:MAG: hypothetical protein KGL43_18020 [Burkholderiales bacterium]|nr:hypothetical protein [Burkholderiales bacterium]MDE2455488.1 hypothetical protein [Burkholderiales bacterium]
MKSLASTMVLTLALAATGAAQAEGAASAAPAKVSAAKKALVAKVLQLQQPGIEGLARQLTEAPAGQLMQQAGVALQRVPPEQREAAAKDIQASMHAYVSQTEPLVRQRAVKLAPTAIGPILEQNFSDEELKQIISILESPVNRKFQGVAGEMQRALAEKVVADTRPTVEPKLKDLEASVVKRLQAANAASAPAPASAAKH